MKRILCAVLIAMFLATPAFAAKVYLKEGGFIQAQRVWREGGKVQVLATRHTMTSFEPCEVDLKRTFGTKRRTAKTTVAATPPAKSTLAAQTGAAEVQKPAEKKAGVSLPSLPKLPERTPESLVPSIGAGGTIKKQKKEMAEKLGEQ